MILGASEWNGRRRTLWVLPVRKEVTQSRALSRILALLRHKRRVWWQTVLNAPERSRRMRAAVSQLSSMVLMSSVAAMRAVLVLWLLRNLDWEGSRVQFFSRKRVSCLLTAFSMTFAGKGSREIGRKFLRSFGSALGFLRRALILTCFQPSGKMADSKELLMIFRSWGAMTELALLRMW
ncbi:hypothetical protein NDU88_004404 [Pleurodeles waltl]|uniref:Uncharacterized protein n=1 Tax=Pleurodeles waltl TaxID=8319 RepID=A0AAV7TU13_PLEWA|nr:hypothetical protein NDU88_004404 [Pleurodeles waltl]